MIFVLVPVAVLYVIVLSQAGFDPVALIPMALVLAVVGSFATLTVTIDDQWLKVKFGYGIYSSFC